MYVYMLFVMLLIHPFLPYKKHTDPRKGEGSGEGVPITWREKMKSRTASDRGDLNTS
jgi:hypothetical protein